MDPFPLYQINEATVAKFGVKDALNSDRFRHLGGLLPPSQTIGDFLPRLSV